MQSRTIFDYDKQEWRLPNRSLHMEDSREDRIYRPIIIGNSITANEGRKARPFQPNQDPVRKSLTQLSMTIANE